MLKQSAFGLTGGPVLGEAFEQTLAAAAWHRYQHAVIKRAEHGVANG